MNIEPHRFVLTKPVIKATSRKDACQIMRDLAKFDLLHLPYQSCWITFNMDHMLDDPDWIAQDVPETNITNVEATFAVFNPVTVDDNNLITAPVYSLIYLRSLLDSTHIVAADTQTNTTTELGKPWTRKQMPPGWVEEVGVHCVSMVGCLLASLAARNINKVVSTNSRGPGTGKRVKPAFQGPGVMYQTSTVLHVPAVVYDSAGGGTHASPIPHLRRGHEHTFRRGVGHSETFKKFIPPIYVNADPSFKPAPKTYTVTA